MRTFFVVNVMNKEAFEKAFQAPYGFSSSTPFTSYDQAVEYCSCKPKNFIVVKVESGEEEVVYENKEG